MTKQTTSAELWTMMTGAFNHNSKVLQFLSKYWCPGTAGIDAFAHELHNFNSWLVPPVCMIGKLLTFMHLYKCSGTLVVPKWHSAYFWPLIANVINSSVAIDLVEYVRPTGVT